MRIGKVEFPRFSGMDVEAWIYRCEYFFTIDETTKMMKQRYAIIYLEGDTIQWHQAFMKTRGATVAELSWTNYARAIPTRFSNAMFEYPMEEIASLQQGTLHEAYGLAKIQNLNNSTFETKFTTAKGEGSQLKTYTDNHRITPPVNASKIPLLPTPNSKSMDPATTKTGAKVSRRLTSKELELKRAKGECFWCTKKIYTGHKYPRNQLFIIEVEDEEEMSGEVSNEEEDNSPQMSIHALTRLPSYSTMRIQGTIGNRQLHILVDSGSTHNFIDVKLANKLQCVIKDIPPLSVGVAGGRQLKCNQMCSGFQWAMQGHWFTTEEGTSPISQRPYRYPAIQKDIIERTTRDLLEAGIIRKSQSSFAALMVLVKKKDGQWRMCMDYRRLNDVTIKDKFPIPLIEELLDELGGETWFSKLDLRFGRFIRSFRIIARPLTNLLKKDAFKWSDETQRSFLEHKTALSIAPVLTLPDFEKQFVIETDACAYGLGAVLMQEKRPIAFLSKAISPKQQGLSVYKKVLLAILMAVKQWHYYLITGPFLIRTEQHGLKHLLMHKVTTSLQHKWLARLLGYDYTIEYKAGQENVAADSLSRVQGLTLFMMEMSQIEPLLLDEIVASQGNDIQLKKIGEQLREAGQVTNMKWNGNWLTRKNRVMVGNDSQLKEKLIRLCHESPMAGHSGINGTIQRIKGTFYWKGISKGVRQFIRNYNVCMRAKYENVASPGLLQPLPIPDFVFSEISMDFIGVLSKVKSLHKAHNRMKQQADKHRTEREFSMGSWVYLKLQSAAWKGGVPFGFSRVPFPFTALEGARSQDGEKEK
nr:hypothetical protein [Tanacetum cinerariifolium]